MQSKTITQLLLKHQNLTQKSDGSVEKNRVLSELLKYTSLCYRENPEIATVYMYSANLHDFEHALIHARSNVRKQAQAFETYQLIIRLRKEQIEQLNQVISRHIARVEAIATPEGDQHPLPQDCSLSEVEKSRKIIFHAMQQQEYIYHALINTLHLQHFDAATQYYILKTQALDKLVSDIQKDTSQSQNALITLCSKMIKFIDKQTEDKRKELNTLCTDGRPGNNNHQNAFMAFAGKIKGRQQQICDEVQENNEKIIALLKQRMTLNRHQEAYRSTTLLCDINKFTHKNPYIKQNIEKRSSSFFKHSAEILTIKRKELGNPTLTITGTLQQSFTNACACFTKSKFNAEKFFKHMFAIIGQIKSDMLSKESTKAKVTDILDQFLLNRFETLSPEANLKLAKQVNKKALTFFSALYNSSSYIDYLDPNEREICSHEIYSQLGFGDIHALNLKGSESLEMLVAMSYGAILSAVSYFTGSLAIAIENQSNTEFQYPFDPEITIKQLTESTQHTIFRLIRKNLPQSKIIARTILVDQFPELNPKNVQVGSLDIASSQNDTKRINTIMRKLGISRKRVPTFKSALTTLRAEVARAEVKSTMQTQPDKTHSPMTTRPHNKPYPTSLRVSSQPFSLALDPKHVQHTVQQQRKTPEVHSPPSLKNAC